MRTLARIGTVLALVASALLLPTTGPEPTDAARAADLSYFDPGNIIADAVFFDSLAVDVPTVQAFLNGKGASCVAGEQPCLKDYRQTTATQAGDAYCSTYTGATNETAAAIIVKVGQACGINPRVLIVLLQKEQGLVTGTRPATVRYTKATGFACPDTAACNPEFSGFASQVYFAARQFQRYAANVAGSYRAGRNNTVLYNPNGACGSSQVYIQNKATAGLYSYTPYQPNAAALAAGYGTGDSCSSYGNRNFWNYFTDWFGSTQTFEVSGAIGDLWRASGATNGSLGAPTESMRCGLAGGGCTQQFRGGLVAWSPATGALSTSGAILQGWTWTGRDTGDLRYPVAEMTCGLRGGGCTQEFQGGTMTWSPATGIHAVTGAINDRWAAAGYQDGDLGYPTSDMSCSTSACTQEFQAGTVVWNAATGAHSLSGAISQGWGWTGRATGPLGYPTTEMTCTVPGGGCSQDFQGGSLVWTPTAGVHAVTAAIYTAWAANGRETGNLGAPTGDAGDVSGTVGQDFTGGRVTWNKQTGVVRVSQR